MSRKGNNATMENLCKTLKYEEVNICEYETVFDVRTGQRAHLVEKVYNHKRFYSALGLRLLDGYEEILRGEYREEHHR